MTVSNNTNTKTNTKSKVLIQNETNNLSGPIYEHIDRSNNRVFCWTDGATSRDSLYK